MGATVRERRPGRLLTLLSFAATLFMPLRSVGAEEVPPDGVILRWDVDAGAGKGCARPQEIMDRVDLILERDAFEPAATAAPWAPTVHVRLLAPDASGRQRAAVTLRTADIDDSASSDAPAPGGPTRELLAPNADCRSLDEPLALVIALMIDAELTSQPEPPPEPPPEPVAEPPSQDHEGPRDRSPTPPSQDKTRRPWGSDAGLQALVASGILPAPAFGGGISGALVSPAGFTVRAHGALFAPRRKTIDETASAKFLLGYGGLAACATAEVRARWRFRPCVGASLGAMNVRPAGLDLGRTATRLVVQGEAGLTTAYRVRDSWLVTASVGALVPIAPDRFLFRNADGRAEPIFRQAPIALIVGLGVAFGAE